MFLCGTRFIGASSTERLCRLNDLLEDGVAAQSVAALGLGPATGAASDKQTCRQTHGAHRGIWFKRLETWSVHASPTFAKFSHQDTICAFLGAELRGLNATAGSDQAEKQMPIEKIPSSSH